MAIEALEGLTDQALFDEANADEVTTEEVVAEPAEEVVEQAETTEQSQARDDQGRFATETKPEAAQPAATQEEQSRGERIPLAEYLSERKRAQTYENELKAEREQRQNLERRLAQQGQPAPVAQAEPEEPDPLLDPKGYREFVLNQTREVILNERREASLERAHLTYKEEFQEAYAAAQKQVDPALKARMQQSRDPGETLIQWHRENKTRAEVGTDLTAYKQRLREEALKDPEFRKQAMEAWRSDAQQQPGSRPVTSLPPSLTRATTAAMDTSADDDDVSNDGLWRHANA